MGEIYALTGFLKALQVWGWKIALVVLVIIIGALTLWKLIPFVMQIIQRWIEIQQAEKDALLRSLNAQSQQLNTILTNHMAHLQQSQENFAKFETGVAEFQGKAVEAMHSLSENVRGGFEVSDLKHGELDKKMEECQKSLAGLHGFIQGRGQ